MSEDFTEEEKRELQLEAIVQAMFEVYEQLEESIPYVDLSMVSNVMGELYNAAEIRCDIHEYVDLTVEFEE